MGILLLSGADTTNITLDSWGHIDSGQSRFFAVNNTDYLDGSVTISGTYSGAVPVAVQAKVLRWSDNSIAQNWVNITLSQIGGGTWAGALNVPFNNPATDAYYFIVRPLNSPAVTATGTERFKVGGIVLCYGQSQIRIMTGQGPVAGGSASSAATGWYNRDTLNWEQPSQGGSLNRSISDGLNTLVTLTGMPWAGVTGAKDGASASELSQGHAAPADYFEQLLGYAQTIGGANAIWYYQGEGDVAITATPDANWFERIVNGIHEPMVAGLGQTSAQIPMFMCSLGPQQSGSGDWGMFRMARRLRSAARCNDYSPNIYYAFNLLDGGYGGDGLHINVPTQLNAAKRFAYSTAYHLGFTANPPLFTIASAAAINGTTTRVTLSHNLGTDFTPTTGIANFEVTVNNWATSVSCTGARVNGTTIDLTHADIGTASRKLRHSYSFDPDVTNYVRDNSAIAVPLNFTLNEDIAVTPASGSRTPQPNFLDIYRSNAFSYIDSSTGVETLNPYIGQAHANRALIIVSQNEGDRFLSSVTLKKAGQSDLVFNAIAGTASAHCGGMVIGAVPTAYGNIVDSIQVRYSGTLYNAPCFAIYSVNAAEMNSLTPVDSDASSSLSAATRTVNLSASTGGFIMASGGMLANDGSISVINGDETYAMNWDNDTIGVSGGAPVVTSIFGFPFANAVGTTAGTNNNTVTVTFDSAADVVGMATASFR